MSVPSQRRGRDQIAAYEVLWISPEQSLLEDRPNGYPLKVLGFNGWAVQAQRTVWVRGVVCDEETMQPEIPARFLMIVVPLDQPRVQPPATSSRAVGVAAVPKWRDLLGPPPGHRQVQV